MPHQLIRLSCPKFCYIQLAVLYSQGGATPIDSIVTAATTLNHGQTTRIGAVNGQSGVKKTVNVQIPVWNGPDYSAVIRSEPVGLGYTCTQSLFPDLQARELGLELKYRDSFAGKISERSKVNGQKLAWSMIKPPKRAGQSFDPRSQL